MRLLYDFFRFAGVLGPLAGLAGYRAFQTSASAGNATVKGIPFAIPPAFFSLCEGREDVMKRLRIRINLQLLRENVSKAEGRQWSEAEVLKFLLDAGFISDGEWWIAREADLGQLDPAEVTAVEDVRDGN